MAGVVQFGAAVVLHSRKRSGIVVDDGLVLPSPQVPECFIVQAGKLGVGGCIVVLGLLRDGTERDLTPLLVNPCERNIYFCSWRTPEFLQRIFGLRSRSRTALIFPVSGSVTYRAGATATQGRVRTSLRLYTEPQPFSRLIDRFAIAFSSNL